MRPLELLLLISIALVAALFGRFSAKPKFIWWLLLLCCCIGILQQVFECFRWQLSFAYLALLMLVLSAFNLNRITNPEQRSRAVGNARKVVCVLLPASLLASFLVPIPTLPKPTGSYSIGSQIYVFRDPARREVLSNEGSSMRQLVAQVWYPTDHSNSSELVPYMQPFSDLSPWIAAPIFTLVASHLPLIKTHATMSAPVSTASPKYPVLIFSHGMMGGRIQNTCLIEELVSHGYIVVGIDHTYDCSFAIFPDRTICSILMTRIPIPLDLIAHPGLEIRVEDARFVASQLETLNKSDRLLSGRMDLAKLGIFGHSLGGQTAMLTIEQDNRFKAALSLDGVNRHLLQRKINQPFMLLQADRLGDPFEVHELCKQFAGPLYCVTLKKSGHANFTDLPLLTPLHWIIGLSGSIDGLRATKIVNAYVVQFFDRYLKQMAAPLLEPHETSMFPEAVVESI